MEFKIRAGEEFIRLGQLLKAVSLVSSGVEAKIAIQDGKVSVNGDVCTQRGKKLHNGDRVLFDGREIIIMD